MFQIPSSGIQMLAAGVYLNKLHPAEASHTERGNNFKIIQFDVHIFFGWLSHSSGGAQLGRPVLPVEVAVLLVPQLGQVAHQREERPVIRPMKSEF